MKVFCDTNVLVSAFATRGLSADLVRLVLTEHEFLTGEVNLAELRRVLRDRFRVPHADIARLVDLLESQTIVPRPPAPSPLKIRDPDDAWVLASAQAAGADYLVTGDQDLLSVANDSPVPIVTPRQCWERLRGRTT